MTTFNDNERFASLLSQIGIGLQTDHLKLLGDFAYDVDELEIESYLLDELCAVKHTAADRNEFWETIVPMISPNSFSEKLLSYLYSERIAIMELCHKEWSDKWLEKFAEFDDAPLYTLIKRYFLENKYSEEQFIRMAKKHIISNDHLFAYILDMYPFSGKLLRLLQLGMLHGEKKVQDLVESYLNAVRCATTVSPIEIANIYEKYKTDFRVLLGVASNPFSPMDILQTLTRISDCKKAKEIRIRSARTLSVAKET